MGDGSVIHTTMKAATILFLALSVICISVNCLEDKQETDVNNVDGNLLTRPERSPEATRRDKPEKKRRTKAKRKNNKLNRRRAQLKKKGKKTGKGKNGNSARKYRQKQRKNGSKGNRR